MANHLIDSLSVSAMSELLQTAGFRAEVITESGVPPVIRSASNGANFEIRLFSSLPNQKDDFSDVMFMVGLRLQGAVAPEFLNRWNSVKRFGRLYITQGHLVLALDIFLQGGVSLDYLRSQLNIWDRLLQELLSYVRTVSAAPAARVSGEPQDPQNGASVQDASERGAVAENTPDVSAVTSIGTIKSDRIDADASPNVATAKTKVREGAATTP